MELEKIPRRPDNMIHTAIEAGKQLAPKVITSPIQDGTPFVILKDKDGGEFIDYITNRFDAPPRKVGCAKFDDIASFAAYWNTHSNHGSIVYANMAQTAFTAVFDEHESSAAHYRQHRALFAPKASPEYAKWANNNGKDKAFTDTEDLAIWIEDQLPDFVSPDGATMLQMALNFKVTQNASFGKAVRLDDGNTQFSYTNEVSGSANTSAGSLRIPEQFLISIPIYAGINAKSYAFSARFRYRLAGSKLSLWYELIRPQKVIESAFSDMCQDITDHTRKEILFGLPD